MLAVCVNGCSCVYIMGHFNAEHVYACIYVHHKHRFVRACSCAVIIFSLVSLVMRRPDQRTRRPAAVRINRCQFTSIRANQKAGPDPELYGVGFVLRTRVPSLSSLKPGQAPPQIHKNRTQSTEQLAGQIETKLP